MGVRSISSAITFVSGCSFREISVPSGLSSLGHVEFNSADLGKESMNPPAKPLLGTGRLLVKGTPQDLSYLFLHRVATLCGAHPQPTLQIVVDFSDSNTTQVALLPVHPSISVIAISYADSTVRTKHPCHGLSINSFAEQGGPPSCPMASEWRHASLSYRVVEFQVHWAVFVSRRPVPGTPRSRLVPPGAVWQRLRKQCPRQLSKRVDLPT